MDPVTSRGDITGVLTTGAGARDGRSPGAAHPARSGRDDLTSPTSVLL